MRMKIDGVVSAFVRFIFQLKFMRGDVKLLSFRLCTYSTLVRQLFRPIATCLSEIGSCLPQGSSGMWDRWFFFSFNSKQSRHEYLPCDCPDRVACYRNKRPSLLIHPAILRLTIMSANERKQHHYVWTAHWYTPISTSDCYLFPNVYIPHFRNDAFGHRRCSLHWLFRLVSVQLNQLFYALSSDSPGRRALDVEFEKQQRENDRPVDQREYTDINHQNDQHWWNFLATVCGMQREIFLGTVER